MVPEVLAHAGEVLDEWDVERFQGGGRTDAGEHEELRGLEGACGEDDFLVGRDGLSGRAGGDVHACRSFGGVEDDVVGESVFVHVQIGSIDGRLEVGGFGGGALVAIGVDGGRAVGSTDQSPAGEAVDGCLSNRFESGNDPGAEGVVVPAKGDLHWGGFGGQGIGVLDVGAVRLRELWRRVLR